MIEPLLIKMGMLEMNDIMRVSLHDSNRSFNMIKPMIYVQDTPISTLFDKLNFEGFKRQNILLLRILRGI